MYVQIKTAETRDILAQLGQQSGFQNFSKVVRPLVRTRKASTVCCSCRRQSRSRSSK